MRAQSCLERPGEIPEAEVAPHEVPRLHAETARASTPEDMSSASGIAPGRSRQLWTQILMAFPARLAAMRHLDVVVMKYLVGCGRGRSFYIGAVAGALHCNRSP